MSTTTSVTQSDEYIHARIVYITSFTETQQVCVVWLLNECG